MSAILVRPNGEYYNIDVVKKITRSMPTEVTSHPVETGSSISDHVILKNKTWKIDGVISDANFKWKEGPVNTVIVPNSVLTWSKPQSTDPVTTVSLRKTADTSQVSVKTNRRQRDPQDAGSFTSRLQDISGNQIGFITQFTQQPMKVSIDQQGQPSVVTDVTVKRKTVTNLPSKPTVTNSFGLNARTWEQYELLVAIRDAREVLTLIHSSGEFDNLVIKEVAIDRDSTISTRSFVFSLDLEQIQIVDKAKTVAIAKLPKAAPKPKAAVAAQCDAKADGGKQTPTEPSTDPTVKPKDSDPSFLRYIYR